MSRLCLSLATLFVTAAVVAGSALADSAYRTERLELRGLAGAQGGGAVVNIHTNGTQVYAHEIYTLRHAAPGSYVVLLNVFPASLDCTGPGSFAVPTAELTTNAVGNGQASFKFTPEDVAPFRGLTLSISWTVVGPATYVSDCTVVTLD